MRTCQRFTGQEHRVIQAGELYRVAGASYSRYCSDCAIEVFGPNWATSPHADICRDGYQVPLAERITN